MPDKPAFDVVFNRGDEGELVIPVCQSDLEKAFLQHVRASKSTLFNRIYDTSDESSAREASVHYAKHAIAAISEWGVSVEASDGQDAD